MLVLEVKRWNAVEESKHLVDGKKLLIIVVVSFLLLFRMNPLSTDSILTLLFLFSEPGGVLGSARGRTISVENF